MNAAEVLRVLSEVLDGMVSRTASELHGTYTDAPGAERAQGRLDALMEVRRLLGNTCNAVMEDDRAQRQALREVLRERFDAQLAIARACAGLKP